MRRVMIVGGSLLLLYILAIYVALVLVPPYAQHLLETGAELPLPTQVLIAASNVLARWFIFIGMALVGGLAWWWMSVLRREASGSGEPE